VLYVSCNLHPSFAPNWSDETSNTAVLAHWFAVVLNQGIDEPPQRCVQLRKSIKSWLRKKEIGNVFVVQPERWREAIKK
jgi:hypothetical protein